MAGILVLPLFTFAATGTNPSISTVPTSNITQTSAKLNGFYNAGSATNINVRFEWGDTPLLGNSTTYQTFTGSGTFEQTITVQPGKTYFVRAMGVATGYTPVFGSTLSFTTPNYTSATVQTMPATNVAQTTATLNGYFNGGGSPTETRFQYANNSAFVGSTYTNYVSMIGNTGTFSAPITGLSQNTTYYFRAIAKNSAGTVTATTALSFTTTGTNPPPPPPNNCVIDSFSANPSQINPGSSSTLSWTTTNCTSVSISGISGTLGLDDSVSTGTLTSDTTFTITATGNGTTDTDTVTVDVITSGGNNDCTIDEFYADPDDIDEGDNTTLFWETTNCTDVDISDGIGDVSNDGDEETDDLFEDESFTITASNSTSSDSKTITVEVDEDNGGNNNNDDDCEIDEFYASPSSVSYGEKTRLYWETTDCEDVYISNIGNEDDEGNVNTNNLYQTTTFVITAFGDDGSDSDSITVYVNGQDDPVIYYPQNPNPAPNPVIHTTTYISTSGTSALVDLDITSGFENVSAGERFEIKIEYANTSSTTSAKESELEIVLPKNLIFERISRGEYSKTDHKVFVDLETISPKEKGEITLQVKVSGKARSGERLVTLGTLNYEKNNVKEEVIDILANKVDGTGSVLGAFAIGGFSGTLISWLVSILLLMIIYAIARQIRKERTA